MAFSSPPEISTTHRDVACRPGGGDDATPKDPLALARLCAQLLDLRKLADVVVVDVRQSLQISDYFVIATGLNSRQLKGACDFLEKAFRDRGVRALGVEGYQEGAWVLLDLDVVVVHLFLEGQRRNYDLELLWGDNPKVPWQPLVAPAAGA
jgi:ribosome-associated protein